MTIQRTHTPARAARRQLLLDRFTEIVSEAGAPYPDALATRLRDVVDDLGFALPAALDDPPPARAHTSDGPGRQEFREARAALAARRTST